MVHGNVDISFFIVPFEVDYTVISPFPVDGDAVMVFD